ncbi:FtsX-like permease family protein [Vibrio sp. S4M6]|uniref:FtsX-like permease family protein n=1 Tax=Vibrio sinus TaxID=2946865 RepID=UPI00202A28FF|nr:FtsX-like permease family protein [Vibrio sinus]MCL9781923.1 FtsX-like permease family protein [Vibrio sinus]
MLWPIVKALLGHYRRYPFQLLLVWLGLTLGVSLLVGVTSISKHVRQNSESGEQVLTDPLPYKVRAKTPSDAIPYDFYTKLQHEGFTQCVPFKQVPLSTVGEGTKIDNGLNQKTVTFVGIDPRITIPVREVTIAERLYKFSSGSHSPIIVSSSFAKRMGLVNGSYLSVLNGKKVGPVVIDNWGGLDSNEVITNPMVFNTVDNGGGVSQIACGDMQPDKAFVLKKMLPSGLVLSRNSRSELESITKAFHMNLTAVGMLSFLVGLFIFYQAMSLSMAQRQRLVGILRQTGVSGWQLVQALLIELFVLILVSWICGNFLGMFLAYYMIPSVSQNIGFIYSGNILSSWSWQSSYISLYMTIAGALLACIWPAVRLLRAQPIRLAKRLSLVRFASIEFAIQTLLAIMFSLIAFVLYEAPKTEHTGLAIIVLTLVSVAMFTPFIIWKLFTYLSHTLRSVKVRWFFSDAAASMSYRGVATMAFMLAVAANVGVETTVGSFRHTTDNWLSQRLAADLYVYPDSGSADKMMTWLEKQPEISQVWQRWTKEILTSSGPLQVVSTGFSKGELKSIPLKQTLPNFWQSLQTGKSILISESMANKLDIDVGEKINLQSALGNDWNVVGIYYDYGNPYNQVLISKANWLNAFAGTGSVSLGLKLPPWANPKLVERNIEAKYHFSDGRVFDNKSIHKKTMSLFDRTFEVADTLGHITLVIAILGVFFATLAGEVSRQRHISLLRCFGVSGREIILIGGLQLLCFGALSILIAMPLGLALAHFIVNIVIEQSFGWTMQLQFIPSQYLLTIVTVMLSLMVAGAIPVLRMIRNTPMKLLKDAI